MYSELVYTIALISIKGVGPITARLLMGEFGSAKAVFEADAQLLMNMPRIGNAIIEQRNDANLFKKAESEIAFIEQHHIKAYIYGTPNYPKRLLECEDAPALLYQLGSTDLNAKHIVGIVGTRNCTLYGRDMVSKFVHELKEAVPDVVIVSGLALGIDVSSHKAALAENTATIGVVAHGLDQVYPSAHKQIARQMIISGGSMISEYPSGTDPERGNPFSFQNFAAA